MAHPFQHLKDHKVQKSRVSSICRASGGRVAGNDGDADEAPRKTAKSKAMKEVFAGGKKSKQRPDKVARKRGGRVKGGKTVVNVNVAPHTPTPGLAPPMPPPPGAMPIGGPGAMAAKPPMLPPPGAGPAGPDGPMPPMPMRATGGRVGADLKDMVKRGRPTDDEGKTLSQGDPNGPPVSVKRKSGGRVNSGTKVFAEGERLGTQVSHDKAKNDTDDMKRPHMKMKPKVVTFKSGGMVKSFRAYGGRVEAPGPGKGMGPKMGGGAESGEGRLSQAKAAKRS